MRNRCFSMIDKKEDIWYNKLNMAIYIFLRKVQ